MPHSIFFRGGYAIHGTNAVGALGRPASHGCVRLAPGAAARLFSMVRRDGARIRIVGSPPLSRSADATEPSALALAAAAMSADGVTRIARDDPQDTPHLALIAPNALVAFDAQAPFDLLEIVAGDELEDMEEESDDAPALPPAFADPVLWRLRGAD